VEKTLYFPTDDEILRMEETILKNDKMIPEKGNKPYCDDIYDDSKIHEYVIGKSVRTDKGFEKSRRRN
jgi:hypothetical protein